MRIKSSYLIGSQAILFCLFLLTTFYFNRFAADDYYFIGELKTKSLSEIYSNLYLKWNGRWTYNFFVLFFLKFNSTSFFLPLYNLLTIGTLYLGIHKLLQSVNTFYHFNFSLKKVTIYSAIALSTLFFCTMEPNDTWLWYTSSVAYLWSVSAFFWGASTFFKLKKNILDYLIVIICSVYIGGSTEPLSIFIILTLVFLLYKKKNVSIGAIALITLASSFLINYFSPGTEFRDELTPNLSLLDLILYTGYGTLKFTFLSIHKTFIPALFLSLPFYILGKQHNNQLVKNFNPTKSLLKSLGIIAITIVLNQLMVTYVLGGLAPDRATISSSIVITIITIRYLFLFGVYHQKEIKLLKPILVINVIALLCFSTYYFNVHQSYAQAIDERLKQIIQSEKKLIEVPPLPKSGYIFNAEITSDTSNFRNQHLKQGLNKEVNIVLKK
ncbi:MAG: DUF6056 family protein [Vicingaceae bacterium]